MKTTLLTSENNILQNNVIVQENQLLAALVESSDISIISEDLKGNITFWNKGAENIFGYSAAEVLGRPITFFIPPEHQHEEEVIQQRILAKEQVPHYKTVRVCKDGRYVYVSVTYSPIRDSRGNIVGTSRIGRDITQEHLNNEQMRALAAIVESSDDAIVSEDINGRITSWNHDPKFLELNVSPSDHSQLQPEIIRAKIQTEFLKRESIEKTDQGWKIRFHGPERTDYQKGVQTAFFAFTTKENLDATNAPFRLTSVRWGDGPTDLRKVGLSLQDRGETKQRR